VLIISLAEKKTNTFYLYFRLAAKLTMQTMFKNIVFISRKFCRQVYMLLLYHLLNIFTQITSVVIAILYIEYVVQLKTSFFLKKQLFECCM